MRTHKSMESVSCWLTLLGLGSVLKGGITVQWVSAVAFLLEP